MSWEGEAKRIAEKLNKRIHSQIIDEIECDDIIAKEIHYPECWDTMAYPTLASALWEMVDISMTGENQFRCTNDECEHSDYVYGFGCMKGSFRKRKIP